MNYKITSIALYEGPAKSQRSITVGLRVEVPGWPAGTTAKVTIVPCYESYEQYGTVYAEALVLTGEIARKYNGWLHGRALPAPRQKDPAPIVIPFDSWETPENTYVAVGAQDKADAGLLYDSTGGVLTPITDPATGRHRRDLDPAHYGLTWRRGHWCND